MDSTVIHGEYTSSWGRIAHLMGYYPSVAYTFPWTSPFPMDRLKHLVHGVQNRLLLLLLHRLLFTHFATSLATTLAPLINQITALAVGLPSFSITLLSLGILIRLDIYSIIALSPYDH